MLGRGEAWGWLVGWFVGFGCLLVSCFCVFARLVLVRWLICSVDLLDEVGSLVGWLLGWLFLARLVRWLWFCMCSCVLTLLVFLSVLPVRLNIDACVFGCACFIFLVFFLVFS